MPPTSTASAALLDIEATLQDTIILGEHVTTELESQTETLSRAYIETTQTVADARQAICVVRAMRSTPYAAWCWLVSWWTWLWTASATCDGGAPLVEPSAPLVDAGTTSPPLSSHAVDGPIPAHVEAQLARLRAQANAFGEQLDRHLGVLDNLEARADEGTEWMRRMA